MPTTGWWSGWARSIVQQVITCRKKSPSTTAIAIGTRLFRTRLKALGCSAAVPEKSPVHIIGVVPRDTWRPRGCRVLQPDNLPDHGRHPEESHTVNSETEYSPYSETGGLYIHEYRIHWANLSGGEAPSDVSHSRGEEVHFIT